MAIIDNTSKTMYESLVNALTTADCVDIEVAFFYFSGWKLLANYLKDKKVRILVVFLLSFATASIWGGF